MIFIQWHHHVPSLLNASHMCVKLFFVIADVIKRNGRIVDTLVRIEHVMFCPETIDACYNWRLCCNFCVEKKRALQISSFFSLPVMPEACVIVSFIFYILYKPDTCMQAIHRIKPTLFIFPFKPDLK
jgi:hypothetical protein